MTGHSKTHKKLYSAEQGHAALSVVVISALVAVFCLLQLVSAGSSLADPYWSEDGKYVIDWEYENAILYYDANGDQVDDPSQLAVKDGKLEFDMVVTLAPGHNSTNQGITLTDSNATVDQQGTVEEWYDTVVYGQHKWREAKIAWHVTIDGLTQDKANVQVKVQDNFTVYCSSSFDVSYDTEQPQEQAKSTGDEASQEEENSDKSGQKKETLEDSTSDDGTGSVHVTMDVARKAESKKAGTLGAKAATPLKVTASPVGENGAVYRLDYSPSQATEESSGPQQSLPVLQILLAVAAVASLLAGAGVRLRRARRTKHV